VSRARDGHPLLLATAVAAILLGLLPLPDWLAPLRPYWIGLVLAYWALEAPHRLGLGLAFLIGIAADLVYGTLLGEQALRLAILVFLVLRFRPRLRFFPLSQQAIAVFALLVNDRVVVLAIRMFTGDGLPPLPFWLSPVIGMLLWPWLFLLLDDLRLRLRSREG
jgi:rod shape-determining protein MreD